jgi:hypothetical protein
MNCGYFAVRKSGGVEARRILRVFVESEANCILVLHVRVLLVLDQGERRWSWSTDYRRKAESVDPWYAGTVAVDKYPRGESHKSAG